MDTRAGAIPITIRGRFLWRGDTRFFIRGVVYQIRKTFDPISDDRLPQLKHDIVLFQELGTNTLYVYSIDNTKAHDQAMRLLDEAGIYVLTTVTTPKCGILRSDPAGSYNPTTIASFFKTVDAMAQYPNVLGLLVADGLINDEPSIATTPYLRAVVRDIKKYMKLQSDTGGQRVLPIGYSAMSQDRTSLADLSLGDSSSSIDFWACNSYEWIGHASMDISGWTRLVQRVKDAEIPIFLSEYGGTIPTYGKNELSKPRLFEETLALYSAAMHQVFSGGCVYEFWQAVNAYGLVEMLPQDGKSFPTAYQASDKNKVFEDRETEEGTLLIYHDFMNYKAGLEANKGLEERWDRSQGSTVLVAQGTPLEMRQFNVPETCIDWEQIMQGMESRI